MANKRDITNFSTEKFVKVSDKWCENHNNNQVKVIISFDWVPCLLLHLVEIGVWADEFCGVVKDFENKDYDVLYHKYNELCATFFDTIPEVVNRDWFIQQGFEDFLD